MFFPPPYDGIFVAPVLDPDQTLAALTSAFSSDQGAAIVEEIKKLTNTVNSICKDFDTIRTLLVRIDLEHGDGPNKTLASQWSVYQSRYDKYLNASRSIALKAKVVASEYILFMSEIELGGEQFVWEELPGFLKSYIEQMDEHIRAADLIQKDFETLCGEIGVFAENLNLLLQRDSEKTVGSNVSLLQIAIIVIQEKLSTWKTFMTAGTVAKCLALGIVGCTAVLAITIVLAPFVLPLMMLGAAGAVGAGIALAAAREIYEGLQLEEEEKQKFLDEAHQRTKKDLRGVLVRVNETIHSVENLSESLGIITNIWKFLKDDADQVQSALEHARESPHAKREFVAKLQLDSRLTCAVYKRTAEALGVYAAQLQ